MLIILTYSRVLFSFSATFIVLSYECLLFLSLPSMNFLISFFELFTKTSHFPTLLFSFKRLMVSNLPRISFSHNLLRIPWNDEWKRQNVFRWQYQNIFPVFLSMTSNNPIEASGVSTTASFSIHEKESSWPFIITKKTLNLRQTMNACTHNVASLCEVLLGLKFTPDLIWNTY